MDNIRKFAFDTEFAADGAIISAAPKKLGPEEVAAECARAYERGAHDSLARAEQEAAAALQALADAASAVLTRLDAESRAMRAEAAQVALAAARKIAGAALNAYGDARIAAAVEAAMDMLRHQPRLVVKLRPEAAETFAKRITDMCETHAYAGAILVRTQDDLRAGEVVIDWSDGVIAMNPEETARRIEELTAEALAAPAIQS